jgi:hypothetical protein
MTGFPHPNMVMAVAAQRQAEMLAEADRYRLVHRAQPDATPLRLWADLVAALAVAVMTALLRAVTSIASVESPRPLDPGFAHGNPHAVTWVRNAHLLDLDAAQQIDTARR